MQRFNSRNLLVALGVTAMLLVAPSASQAQFLHNLFHCNKCATPTTAAYAPACGQTCNYVPQTCYRVQCVNVPVTTFRPVTTCDPCTGCPRTALSPITTCVRQQRLVPYTTYRLVYSNPCATPCATGACAPATTAMVAPTTTMFAPTTGLYGPATITPSIANCPTCVAGSANYAPATNMTNIAPNNTYMQMYPAQPTLPVTTSPAVTTTVPVITNPAPIVTPPSTVTIPSTSGTTTFQSDATTNVQRPIAPVPDPTVNTPTPAKPMNGTPRLIAPEGRVTQYPVRQAWAYGMISWPQTSEVRTASATPAIATPKADDGWRPASN